MDHVRILVVEDENIIAADLEARLTDLGYTVVATAASGEESLQRIEELRPDIILMDIVLRGEMDGVQAAEHIRAQFGLPVIYLTAYSDNPTLQRARVTEPYGYVLKPFEDRELLTAIEIGLYKHRMDRKLRESEHWLAATLRSIGDAVVATDATGRIKFMNQVAETLTGWRQADAVGQEAATVLQLRHATTHAPLPDPVQQALHAGTAISLANPAWLALENADIPIEVTAALIRDDLGNITGVVLVIRDIAERLQSEAALEQSRAKYRNLVENAGAGVVTIDRQGCCTFVNEALCQIVGHTKEELLGQTFTRFLHPDDAQRALELFGLALLAPQGKGDLELRLVHKEGHLVYCHISPTVFWYEGHIVEFIAIIQDITEHWHAGEALRQSENKYRTLFETMAQGVVYQDPDGKIISANPAAERILGLALNRMQGRTPMDSGWRTIHEDGSDFPGETHPTLMALSTGTEVKNVVMGVYNPQDRAYRWITVHAVPQFRPKEDPPYQVYATFEDITERKRIEEALHQYTLELQARNDELDAYAHTVAHDLKNPLHTIISYSELMQQDWEMTEVERKRCLQAIMLGGHKMQNIIDELLLLAQVRRTDVEIGPLNMASIVAEALRRLDYMVQDQQVEISVPAASAWPVAVGYAPWIEEVWVNYVSNAIKYGGTPPHVELGAETQADGTMRFWVRDNGAGITPEQRERLFTPFTQLSQARAKGYGLGLSIVRRIVEKLGGRVGLESKGVPGQGSMFYFTLASQP